MRQLVHLVRRVLFAPLNLVARLGFSIPTWLLHAVIVIDRPLRGYILRQR